MTDRYADLRAALADAQSADGDCVMPVIETDTLSALLADYDRLRKDLEEIASIDWVDATFDPQMAIHIAKASLEQGDHNGTV